MLIRGSLLSLSLLAVPVLAKPPAPSPAQPPASPTVLTPATPGGNEVHLPGGVGRIRAGAGTAATPAQASPSHHVRRQDQLRHAQNVIVTREQLREQAIGKLGSAP